MSRTDIRNRIDAALEKMAWRQMDVRAIYLNAADAKALNRVLSAEFGKPFNIHACGYRGHILRQGKRSSIFSRQGVEVAVPKLLSHRIAA